MRTTAMTAIIIAALATAGFSAEKARKPRLDLRAAPAHGLLPRQRAPHRRAHAAATTSTQLYCPEIEWNWDDGGKSVHEADCAPLEAGGTFERRYTANHAFRQAGHLQRQDHHAEGQPLDRGGHGDGDRAPRRRRLGSPIRLSRRRLGGRPRARARR